MSLHAKVAGAWQEIGDGGGPSGVPWAVVSGGTVTTVYNPDGSVDEVHTFTADSSLTVESPGYARVLVVGGATVGTGGNHGGGGGGVREGLFALPSGALPVVVCAAGTAWAGNAGDFSSLGSIVRAGGARAAGALPRAPGGAGARSATNGPNNGGGGADGDGGPGVTGGIGVTSDISGTLVEYGRGGDGAAMTAPAPNTGSAGNGTVASAAGVVIVRVQVSPARPLPTTQEGWARVTGGTVTEYAKPDGSIMEVHEFTAAGTLTVETPGYAEVLLVSGGGSTNAGQSYRGSGGVCREGLQMLPAGGLPVVIGAGGLSRNADMWLCIGRPSSLGSFNTGFARSGDATGPASGAIDTMVRNTPYTSFITGVARTFGVQGANGAAPRANSGDSGHNDAGAGATGSVIVAVQKSAPTVSGVVATGGTVRDWTGDGTTGVLGQKYREHKFTGNGSLVVTQGGDARFLVIGGGSKNTGLATPLTPMGGQNLRGITRLSAGTLPVVVGAGAAGGPTIGGGSSLGGLAVGASGFAGETTFTDNITGTAVEYARPGQAAPRANTGDGGAHGNPVDGAAGVVIVRYEIA